jgi:hypothetical protein
VASNDSRSQKASEFWKYVEDNYHEVASWPRWMRGASAGAQPASGPAVEDTEEDGTAPPVSCK